ncbi:hypothetical protein G7Y89_g10734 [Cudoniella acicularis]|uniref:Uncharacterized protein n=1 Tax=Cudoniella acicularis TaxID=354080 RepID=A0A8H4VYG9_9HELO|nr:hypothetical protein G7Y89_g10734 [Cudoniella acicularis]
MNPDLENLTNSLFNRIDHQLAVDYILRLLNTKTVTPMRSDKGLLPPACGKKPRRQDPERASKNHIPGSFLINVEGKTFHRNLAIEGSGVTSKDVENGAVFM